MQQKYRLTIDWNLTTNEVMHLFAGLYCQVTINKTISLTLTRQSLELLLDCDSKMGHNYAAMLSI